MTRGIQNIDAVIVIFKLHDGRGHGDPALLFDFHPVRDRVAHVALAFDHAGLLDGPSVQEKFFCQCRFAGVRVRDDRKGAAAFDFLFIIHKVSESSHPRE